AVDEVEPGVAEAVADGVTDVDADVLAGLGASAWGGAADDPDDDTSDESGAQAAWPALPGAPVRVPVHLTARANRSFQHLVWILRLATGVLLVLLAVVGFLTRADSGAVVVTLLGLAAPASLAWVLLRLHRIQQARDDGQPLMVLDRGGITLFETEVVCRIPWTAFSHSLWRASSGRQVLVLVLDDEPRRRLPGLQCSWLRFRTLRRAGVQIVEGSTIEPFEDLVEAVYLMSGGRLAQ
ncbi:MAG: hypothetical protein Q4G45_08765, partial [Actinomycetia bacterium]|nr:hypothetical protein [Actinomycetes bacterium]